MANNQNFVIKNGLSAKRFLQNGSALSANDVDLSTGSYFTKTLSDNTTFTFSNPAPSGKAQSFALEVTGADVTIKYDLENPTFEVNFDPISNGTSGQSRSIAFKSDGTKCFTTGFFDDAVREFDLSTAYDLNTATYSGTTGALSNIRTGTTAPLTVRFKPDGTAFYIADNGSDEFQHYTLSTAWDVTSTVAFDSRVNAYGLSSVPASIVFNDDGTQVLLGESNDGRQRLFNLTNAYDFSFFSLEETNILGADYSELQPNDDFTFMYAKKNNSTIIRRWAIPDSSDFSTIDWTDYDDLSAGVDSSATGLMFDGDGSKMYLSTQNTGVNQFDVVGTSGATITWPSSVKWDKNTTPTTPANGEKDVFAFVTTDGGTRYLGKQVGDAVA